MNFEQAFKLAIKSMKGSKVRSILTMLGIIIGVAAVIILVSLISGFSSDMTTSFEAMGTNLITVSIPGRGGNVKVTPDEVMTFAQEHQDTIAYVSPSVNISSATIKYGDTNLTTTVYGVNEYYDKIKNYTAESGRFLGYIDVERRQKVCLLGKYVATKLFPSGSPIGEELKINGEQYTVIGVIEAKNGATEGSGDDMIMVPYTSASRLSKNASVSSYYFSAASSETSDAAISEIKAFLLTYFSNTKYYRVFNQADQLDMVNQLSGTLTLVLVGVAGISLLVGGIGIMNIMLVSVTERTKEIGIRKSVGGKRKDILRQFIIEAATTSAMGGIIGIVFGCVCAIAAGKIFSMTVLLSINAIIIAFSVSVGIGIIFGYFPAAKAAKLNPIDALRYD